ncbi:MAG: addiction module protein [Candidatus Hydrogenedentes bacterium]|nr:addiction module protein [Candidatus Hydrogenedentota bacterium]
MSPNALKLMDEVLQLPPDERALLSEKLLESLDSDEPFEISEEWKAEIERRCKAVDRGEVELLPGEQVLKEVFDRLR